MRWLHGSSRCLFQQSSLIQQKQSTQQVVIVQNLYMTPVHSWESPRKIKQKTTEKMNSHMYIHAHTCIHAHKATEKVDGPGTNNHNVWTNRSYTHASTHTKQLKKVDSSGTKYHNVWTNRSESSLQLWPLHLVMGSALFGTKTWCAYNYCWQK